TPAPASGRKGLRSTVSIVKPPNVAAATTADARALVIWLVLAVTSCVAIGLVYVWLRLKVMDLGYQISATRQLIERLRQEGHELDVEVARLAAPDRLEQAARGRLGMTRPVAGQEAVLP